jgi:TetR/AcrR family transcriptional regulator
VIAAPRPPGFDTPSKPAGQTLGRPRNMPPMRTVPSSLAERLFGAAHALAEQGIDEVRVDDLAAATGIPRATLYYYFAGKDDMLAFLLRSMLDEVRTAVEDAVAAGGDAAHRLELVMRAQLAAMARNPDVSRLLATNLGRAGRLPDIAAAVRASFNEPVERLFVEGGEDGSLRCSDPGLGAAAVYGAVVIAGLHQLIDGDLDVDAVSSAVIPLLLDGAHAHGPNRRRSR